MPSAAQTPDLVNITVYGLPEFYAKLALADTKLKATVAIATKTAADDLLEKTLPFTPIDEGDLRSTGEVVSVGPFMHTVQFGGPDAPYAVFVHEDLEAYHAAPTKAKFLESTYAEHSSDYAADIISASKASFGKL